MFVNPIDSVLLSRKRSKITSNLCINAPTAIEKCFAGRAETDSTLLEIILLNIRLMCDCWYWDRKPLFSHYSVIESCSLKNVAVLLYIVTYVTILGRTLGKDVSIMFHRQRNQVLVGPAENLTIITVPRRVSTCTCELRDIALLLLVDMQSFVNWEMCNTLQDESTHGI